MPGVWCGAGVGHRRHIIWEDTWASGVNRGISMGLGVHVDHSTRSDPGE